MYNEVFLFTQLQYFVTTRFAIGVLVRHFETYQSSIQLYRTQREDTPKWSAQFATVVNELLCVQD